MSNNIHGVNLVMETILNYCVQCDHSFNRNELSEYSQTLSKLIAQGTPIHVVADSCEELIGTSQPIEEYQLIMKCGEQPPIENPLTHRSSFKGHSSKNAISKKKGRSWTREEDRRLIYGVSKFGIGSWSKIAVFVGGGRNRSTCSQRWFRVLNPNIEKGDWTQEEELNLCRLAAIHGTSNWSKVSHLLNNRSDVQCRYHYAQMQKTGKLLQYQPQMQQILEQHAIQQQQFQHLQQFHMSLKLKQQKFFTQLRQQQIQQQQLIQQQQQLIEHLQRQQAILQQKHHQLTQLSNTSSSYSSPQQLSEASSIQMEPSDFSSNDLSPDDVSSDELSHTEMSPMAMSPLPLSPLQSPIQSPIQSPFIESHPMAPPQQPFLQQPQPHSQLTFQSVDQQISSDLALQQPMNFFQDNNQHLTSIPVGGQMQEMSQNFTYQFPQVQQETNQASTEPSYSQPMPFQFPRCSFENNFNLQHHQQILQQQIENQMISEQQFQEDVMVVSLIPETVEVAPIEEDPPFVNELENQNEFTFDFH